MEMEMNKDDDEVLLPGFRFHPTDEELVGFYLRRKVEKKPIKTEVIKHIDIYKYDPWDIPRASHVGDKEGFFFCLRGRKYRNSVRPNRVTGSGFWKATGIDKPIYSAGHRETTHDCIIGLKKSLVYYRGSAGKGAKTDWMMHEFRLPLSNAKSNTNQEAEVWTLCRIFKRNVSYRKHASDWQESPSKQSLIDTRAKTCSRELEGEKSKSSVISGAKKNERKVVNDHNYAIQVPFIAPYMSFSNLNGDHLFGEGSWDELGPIVDFALHPSLLYG